MAVMATSMEDLIVSIVDRRFDERKEELIEEVKLDLLAKRQQTLFSQKELATHYNVSTQTIYRWRVAGLESEPSQTGELRFDLNKVENWRKENDKRKVR